MIYKLLRPLLFGISKDPETTHNLALYFLKFTGINPFRSLIESLTKVSNPLLEQKVFGLNFKNPVGLAAGFDKHADAIKGLEALGFGFLEIGTVTKLAQAGNPRQRIFRLVQDQALINRMGFNNNGADALAKTLKDKSLYPSISTIGINLGKSKAIELTDAHTDYLYSFSKLYEFGDYFVVNISSPNTPGLRQLQGKKYLVDILSGLSHYRVAQKNYKPILVKMVIDFTLEAVDEILEACKELKIDGIIVSNTSLMREGLKTKINEVGGLSGLPIKEKATVIIRHIHKQSPNLPIIGVGGIFTAKDAYEKILAGASLIQIYTGLIYEGPSLIKKINKGLVEFLKRDGFKNIAEAVGTESKI